jgi:FSR family fosmidomycin resistance protein-like MFS transporter
MDTDPARHEHNMARWTFAGSLGVVSGSLALVASGSNWRGMFFVTGVMTLVALIVVWNQRHLIPQTGNGANGDEDEEEEPLPFMTAFKNAFAALKRREVVRWLTLLEFSDLMLDGLHGYLALYFVDVAGTDPKTAALGVAVWTGVGLVGDFLLIPLLERINGLTYLRYSVVVEMILFPLFLIVAPTPLKMLILAFIGLFNAGWYAILQGRLYSVMPGQSGSVMAISNVSGLFGGLIPLGLGIIAQQFGLHIAMWLFMAGPIALMIGLPRHNGFNHHE